VFFMKSLVAKIMTVLCGVLLVGLVAQRAESQEVASEAGLVGAWQVDMAPILAAAPPEAQAMMAGVSMTFTFNADHTMTMASAGPAPEMNNSDAVPRPWSDRSAPWWSPAPTWVKPTIRRVQQRHQRDHDQRQSKLR
jgi:hypothetical protein